MAARAGQINQDRVACGCGRSPTGFCCGWHALSEAEYNRKIMEGHVYPGEEPKEIKQNES